MRTENQINSLMKKILLPYPVSYSTIIQFQKHDDEILLSLYDIIKLFDSLGQTSKKFYFKVDENHIMKNEIESLSKEQGSKSLVPLEVLHKRISENIMIKKRTSSNINP
jgi:hypothetical protein